MGTVTELSQYRDKKQPTIQKSRVLVGLNPDDNKVYVSIIGNESLMFGLHPSDAEVLGVELTKAAQRAAKT